MKQDTILEQLELIIADRKANPPEKSYVSALLKGGIDKMGAKINEEARELIEAALETDHAHTVYEAADLFFHILVLLGYKQISLQEVYRELERRFGTSGITEKESRKKQE